MLADLAQLVEQRTRNA